MEDCHTVLRECRAAPRRSALGGHHERLYKAVIHRLHEQPGAADGPVVMVSYDGARSYASTRGGRLLRSEEWDAAVVTPGVVVADGVLEWVESSEGKRTVRQHGKVLQRPDKEQKDVTFRVAKDP